MFWRRARVCAGVGLSFSGTSARGFARKRSASMWRGSEAELLDHLARVVGVGHQPVVLDVRVTLADEPLLGIPGAAFAFAGDTLDAALAADVLGAERLEFALRPDLDVEEVDPSPEDPGFAWVVWVCGGHGPRSPLSPGCQISIPAGRMQRSGR